MQLARFALTLALLSLPALHASAQETFNATIELPGPGPTRFLVVSSDPRGLHGCVSAPRPVCTVTQIVVLDAAARRELHDLIAAMEARMRCPPPRAEEGDPRFSIETSSGTFEGALPRDPAQIPARTSGACAASERLAWWLVQHFPHTMPRRR